jgi:hypothetical protein
MQREPSAESRPAVPSQPERQILVVAGSGRSGTSLFTGLTGHLGLHIPKPEVKANRSNPRGFGEPRWAVDFHNDLLSAADVSVDDGRPEAWDLTDDLAERNQTLGRLTAWLEEQFDESPRIVVKDPRLAWFIELYRVAARGLDADLRVATMLRHPAEVLRSRELAYGTKTTATTRAIGWVNMMLGIEARTRDLPRTTVRYDDLLSDWRAAMELADASLGLDLLADPAAIDAAGSLIDPSLRRSVTEWSELDLPPTVLDLASRVYDAYGELVGLSANEQARVRAALDDLRAEFFAYYDECFDVSRSRTGAHTRRERRRAVRRVREELSVATAPDQQDRPLDGVRKRLGSMLHREGRA